MLQMNSNHVLECDNFQLNFRNACLEINLSCNTEKKKKVTFTKIQKVIFYKIM